MESNDVHCNQPGLSSRCLSNRYAVRTSWQDCNQDFPIRKPGGTTRRELDSAEGIKNGVGESCQGAVARARLVTRQGEGTYYWRLLATTDGNPVQELVPGS